MKNKSEKWILYKPNFEFTSDLSIESSAWSGHYFFAYDLVANTKPKVIVELGTHKGNSLFSFAQAIKDFNLDTELHAIDTWQGDEQAGFYGEEVYEEFLRIKDKYYKNVNIVPHKMLFDEAVEEFEDNSIDILHIDGLHTYEAVKHDFETWLPKVKKESGIILLHDVCEKSDDFGVYKLWDELEKKYGTITFEHYHGLGVVCLEKEITKRTLSTKTALPQYYESVSKANRIEKELTEKEEKIKDLTKKDAMKNQIIKKLEKKQLVLEVEIDKLEEFKTEQEELRNGLTQKVSKVFQIIKRLISYAVSFPKLLTEYPLKEIPLRTYVALRYLKYTEYNRDYQIYLRQNKLDSQYYSKARKEISNFKQKPLISIIMPVYNVDLKWIKKAVNSVKNQIYCNWELCIADDASSNPKLIKYLKKISREPKINVVFREENGHISEASNTAISIAKGEYLAFMDNDDVIHPQALYKIAKVINKNPTVGLMYSDEDKMELNGTRCDPIFKSDYSPNYLLSTNYFCHLTTIKKELVEKVGGFRTGYEGSQDYDLFLRVVELLEEDQIVHIPDILYSWRKIPGSTALTYDQKGYAQKASIKALRDAIYRRNIDGEISNGLQGGFFKIKYNINGKPLVSIIITNKEKSYSLDKSIKKILKITDYNNYEIIIVSSDKKSIELVQSDNIHFYYFEEYNIPKMRNFAAKKSNGEYLVFAEETLNPTSPKWIERLLEYAQKENIGAVGPKLLSCNKEVLGTSFWLDENNNIKNVHAFLPPHMQVRANLVADYTIISDLLFMISKERFQRVGGFKTDGNRIFSWTDFFIKLSEEGLYNTYTPHLEAISSEKIKIQQIIKVDKTIGEELRSRINTLERKLF